MHSVIILSFFSLWFTYPEIRNNLGRTIGHKIFFLLQSLFETLSALINVSKLHFT